MINLINIFLCEYFILLPCCSNIQQVCNHNFCQNNHNSQVSPFLHGSHSNVDPSEIIDSLNNDRISSTSSGNEEAFYIHTLCQSIVHSLKLSEFLMCIHQNQRMIVPSFRV